MSKTKPNISLIVFVIFLIASIGILVWQIAKPAENLLNSTLENSSRATTEISIVYAPELEPVLVPAMQNFNQIYESGINPVNNQKLTKDEKKIKITGQKGSSGEVRTQIVSAVLKQNTDKIAKPTIYAPTVSSWLGLVNLESGKTVFDTNNLVSTATSPVGIGIWESRLQAIQNKTKGSVGVEDVLKVSQSANGWQDYNKSFARKQVYVGMTNPQISSTAVSALVSQYYAAATNLGKQIEQLTLSDVKDIATQKKVQNFQSTIRHYSSNTVVFRDYLARGPDYIDMLPLAENDLIYVNQGQGGNKPSEKLVMLYPKEGSIVHDYPMAIPNSDWVNEEQKQAANNFVQYILSEKVQEKYVENGFRPIGNTKWASPLTSEFGIDTTEPKKVLKLPTADVISEIQLNWDFVKKPSEVMLLLDTSGSMSGEKIENAKKALRLFIEKISPRNQVGLKTFDSTVRTIVNMQPLESGKNTLKQAIDELTVQGSTSLYNGIAETLGDFNQQNKCTDKTSLNCIENTKTTKAIILLSDGEDTVAPNKLSQIVGQLEQSQLSDSPVLLIPIGYGEDADLNGLGRLATSSKTTVQVGQTKDIDKLLESISSYF